MRYGPGLAAFCLAVLVLVPSSTSLEGGGGSQAAGGAPSAPGLTVVQVRPNVHMIAGAGANVVVHVGRDGAIVVDTGRVEHAAPLLDAIARLTSGPIRYIINTSADADHVGGNAVLSAAGQPITAFGYRRDAFVDRQYAPILATEAVVARMSAPTGAQAPYPVAAWPTSSYSPGAGEHQRKLVLNGEAIQVMHQPAAHSDGDSVVYLRRSDVVVTGDVFDMTRFPLIDLEKGGSIGGVIDSLNRLIDMTFAPTPLPFQADGTLIVPGHGRLAMTTDLVNYRDMVVIVRDRVADLAGKGKTLPEIQAASPALGYTRRFGSDSGAWTTAMFVEAIHKSLASPGGGR